MDAIFKKESKQGAGSIWQSMFDERCSEIGPQTRILRGGNSSVSRVCWQGCCVPLLAKDVFAVGSCQRRGLG